MNSYTLTEKLRKARRRYCISAGAQGLFYELVAINNEEQWSGIFKCTNGELTAALNIAEKTLIVFRDELAKAGLLVFISGKSKRQPCSYSLNGCLNDLPIDLRNGGKIYSSSVSQTVSLTGENITDLNKTKSKTETKLKLEVDDDKARSRKNEFDQAMEEYFNEPDKNANASQPESAYLPDEKEKNCAKKEKVFPTVDDAIQNIQEMAYWRNVVEQHKVEPGERIELFKIFYAQKEDHYRIRYPTWLDMVQHFYNWVPIHLNKAKIQKLIPQNYANTFDKNTGNGPRKRTEEVKRDVTNFVSKSAEFLRKTAGS